MQMLMMKLKDIIPYKNNPRLNDDAVDDVAESIKQCGYCAPIILDEKNVILAGHTRLKALQKLNWDEAEVVVKEGLTDKQKKKYRLLDNKTGEKAQWDIELLELELADLDFEGFDFGFETNDAKIEEREEISYNDNISLLVQCEDETQAQMLFDKLTAEGYSCQVSTL